MSRDIDMATRFRGLNIEQVDEYLNNLKQIYSEEISNLKKQIETSYKEKDRLYQKLLNLQAEKEKQQKSKELLDLALIRAKEAVSYFENKAEEESEDILRAAKQQNEIFEKKINDIDNDIKFTKMHVESLLQDMMKILQNSRQDKENEKEEAGTGKVVGKIFPASSRLKKDNQAAESNGETVEEKENIRAENKQKITADGIIATDQHYKRFAERISGLLAKPAAPKEKPLQDEPEDEKVKREFSGEGFWEECSGLSSIERETASEFSTVIEIGNYIKHIGSVRKKEVDILAAVQEAASANMSTSAAKELLSDEKTDVKNDASMIIERADSGRTTGIDYPLGKSPAVAAEISNIRFKYIVGKLAGEDLFDSNGRLIIAKKEKITSEVVALAEAEGRLPELIVNMILPGMED